MIGTAAAILGASVLGAGASILSSNKAVKSAAETSQNATDQAAAVQNRALDLQQQNTATSRAVGDSALTALANRQGLDVPGITNQPSTTGQGQSAGPQYNYQAYLDANPDVAAEAQKAAQEVGDVNGDGSVNPLDYAKWHYEHYGQQEGRQLPTANDSAVGQFDNGDVIAAPPPAQAFTMTPDKQVNDQGFYQAQRPEVAPPPVYQAPTLTTAPVYTPPPLTAAPTYTAPTYRETQVAPLDVGLDKYQQSPDYNFQLEEGNRNILANKAATGQLESGAALKALQKYGQDLALGDYSQWRDYSTGQYNQDRSYTANRDDAYNSNATNNAQFGYNALNNDWQFSNTLNTNNAQFGFNALNNDWQYSNNYSANNALNNFNSANTTYQYGTSLGQNAFNSDRDYATGQSNYNNNALLSLAGIGSNATALSNNALGSNANALSNAYLSNASVQGNAALAGAGQTNNLISQGGNALAYYYGNSSVPKTGINGTAGIPQGLQGLI